MRRRNCFNQLALIAFALLLTVSCSRETHHEESAMQVSLCELYTDPDRYEGKRIRVSATIAQFPNGKYLYPEPSCGGGYWYVRFEGNNFGNDALKELESSTGDGQSPKEFDLEVSGIFDSKYAEAGDAFRYRIFPLEVRQQSEVRISKPKGAA
jgi:hypothetical protein